MLSDGSLRIVMSSSANGLNPTIRRSIMEKQLEVENTDREPEWGHKEGYCLKAYAKAREEIILDYAPNLTTKEVEHLTKATRGMMELDIKKSVDNYLGTGQFPKEPDHPTITCDPFTGNWAEHLMDPYRLEEILSGAGFEVEVLGGYFGSRKKVVKNIIGFLRDFAVYACKKQGLRIAPFYTLLGRRIVK